MRLLRRELRDAGPDSTAHQPPSTTAHCADTAGFATVWVLVAGPLLAVVVLLVAVLGGGAGEQPLPMGCGGAGSATTVGTFTLDAEQLSHAQTIVTLTATRRLRPYAAVIAVATAYQESRLRNLLTQVDHDSIGLFQLRVSLWSAPVAADPVRSTGWFLDHLVSVPDWQRLPLTVAAQAVQRSAFPEAYAAWQPLAAGVVGQLWPTAAATAATADSSAVAATSTAPSSSPGMTVPPVLCPQVGDGVPVSAGGTDGISVPAGLRISGSPAGILAARFALAQLGKPYLWGAAGPGAYDCSGLTMAAWAYAGVALAHFTGDQVTAGTPSPNKPVTGRRGGSGVHRRRGRHPDRPGARRDGRRVRAATRRSACADRVCPALRAAGPAHRRPPLGRPDRRRPTPGMNRPQHPPEAIPH